MTKTDLIEALRDAMPIALEALTIEGHDIGLVIVDEVNGFATVGAGNLAPPTDNAQVLRMIAETDRLARGFAARGLPMLAFLDTHEPGRTEPPYPPHCERGSGEEDLVPALAWLADEGRATLVRKDCINGFIGAIDGAGRNALVDWVDAHRLARLLVVGICTDICVMDFVLTTLSARNHAMMPTLVDILVHAGACATFDLPRAAAETLGYGAIAAHPQDATHHLGLYFMASRGARLVEAVRLG